MTKIPVDWRELNSKQLLALARRAVQEYNDSNLDKYKLVRR